MGALGGMRKFGGCLGWHVESSGLPWVAIENTIRILNQVETCN